MRPNDVTILALEHKEHPKWTLQYLKLFCQCKGHHEEVLLIRRCLRVLFLG